MESYKTKIIEQKKIAEGTPYLVLEKPADFKFKAGQFTKLIIPQTNSNNERDKWRWFSICSAPEDKYIAFCGRTGDSLFKQAWYELQPGDEVEISEPKGKFTLPSDQKVPIVFLIGGVGITPVYSMINSADAKKRQQPMTLFYSNYRPEDAPFLKELLHRQDKNFKLVATMTKMENSSQPWQGETGYINIEMIKKYVADISRPLFYIVGSTGFVVAMRKMLKDNDVEEDNIVIENFTGL